MQRFLPYIGVLAGIILGVVMFVLSDQVTLLNFSPVPPLSTSTLSVVPSIPAPSITLPRVALPTSTPVALPPPVKKRAAPTASEPAMATQPAAPSDLADASVALRSALVNILCYSSASGIQSISGSGVIIDPKGIILTNAHVAQYFLLSDHSVRCTIRSGSPASDAYGASAIFISPAWIRANASAFTQQAPTGTGEHDFALVAVTKSLTSAPLPSSFSYLPLALSAPTPGTPVVIGSYGAQFLQSAQIQSDLFPTIAYGSVKDVYTFAVNTIDVLALGGSAAAQEGSSGGGIATGDSKLAGTITTSTVEGDTSTRQLDGITASYIRADYASQTGMALDTLLAEPTATSIANFATQIPALEAELTANLP